MKVFYYSFASLKAFYIVDDGGMVMVSKTPYITKDSNRSRLNERDILRLCENGTIVPHNTKAAIALSEFRKKQRNINLALLCSVAAIVVWSILLGVWS